ncbi:11433_t:CDS:2, partial [Cetraspora pellucida]
TTIPDKHIESINRALIKAFVCCGLPWRLIEHPFFVEFLKQLRPAYTPPNRKTVANTLLKKEIIRIDTCLYKLLKGKKNLTLALDGWTSLTGKSLWNFVIYLDDGKDILCKIQDYSNTSHTAEFLITKIQKILNDIG